jgi:hypothetical protein
MRPGPTGQPTHSPSHGHRVPCISPHSHCQPTLLSSLSHPPGPACQTWLSLSCTARLCSERRPHRCPPLPRVPVVELHLSRPVSEPPSSRFPRLQPSVHPTTTDLPHSFHSLSRPHFTSSQHRSSTPSSEFHRPTIFHGESRTTCLPLACPQIGRCCNASPSPQAVGTPTGHR